MTTISQTTIQGSVSDRIDPLPWANIYIKNTNIGTVADDKGNFALHVQKGDALAILYAGYQTKEIVIDTQKEMTAILENEILDEVFVTAQAIRRCKTVVITCFRKSRNSSTSKNTGIKIETIPDDITSKNTNLSLFPNPSSDGIFKLKMANSHKEVQVYVTNILGQQVQSKVYQNTNNTVTLDLSSLRTGIYLINSMADGERLPTQKAIRR
ncbi:MAG: hypothetical protein ACI9Y7_000818 [Dokdonia sp.]|jgi:hypothetical protein